MKGTAILGIAAGAVLVLSALAHAFLGWPALHPALAASGVDESLIGAIAVGWYFGSVAMAVFGLIVLVMAVKLLRGRTVDMAPVAVMALGYLGFGLAAFLARDLNPHFLLFIGTGLLLGAFAFVGRAKH